MEDKPRNREAKTYILPDNLFLYCVLPVTSNSTFVNKYIYVRIDLHELMFIIVISVHTYCRLHTHMHTHTNILALTKETIVIW